jgi:hypothetical protein
MTLFRGALPKVNSSGSAKQAALNHCVASRAPPSFGSQI